MMEAILLARRGVLVLAVAIVVTLIGLGAYAAFSSAANAAPIQNEEERDKDRKGVMRIWSPSSTWSRA